MDKRTLQSIDMKAFDKQLMKVTGKRIYDVLDVVSVILSEIIVKYY